MLIGTKAFGMGVDCKYVNRIVHYGSSKSMDNYVQETGQAARVKVQNIAFVLYHGIFLNHVEGQMKSFLKTNECRRQSLIRHLDTALEQPVKSHLCCDNCAVT